VSQRNFFQDISVPVIAIDGGAGTGKGTTRSLLAKALGFHQLDSGCLYRAVAWLSPDLDTKNPCVRDLVGTANGLELSFDGETVCLGGKDVTKELRADSIGKLAAVISKIPEVRNALLRFQCLCRQLPGLVADGRDMGEIFEDPSCFRYFIITDPEERARRRVLFIERMYGIKPDYNRTLFDILERDHADQTREHSPLRMHTNAVLVNNTNLSPEETVSFILDDYRSRSTR
jgi:cytidylate kinase